MDTDSTLALVTGGGGRMTNDAEGLTISSRGRVSSREDTNQQPERKVLNGQKTDRRH